MGAGGSYAAGGTNYAKDTGVNRHGDNGWQRSVNGYIHGDFGAGAVCNVGLMPPPSLYVYLAARAHVFGSVPSNTTQNLRRARQKVDRAYFYATNTTMQATPATFPTRSRAPARAR